MPVKLAQYPVPKDLKACVLEDGDVVKVCPKLTQVRAISDVVNSHR